MLLLAPKHSETNDYMALYNMYHTTLVYSLDFAPVFLPLVQNSEITALLKNAERTDPVSNFLAECSNKRNNKDNSKVLFNYMAQQLKVVGNSSTFH